MTDTHTAEDARVYEELVHAFQELVRFYFVRVEDVKITPVPDGDHTRMSLTSATNDDAGAGDETGAGADSLLAAFRANIKMIAGDCVAQTIDAAIHDDALELMLPTTKQAVRQLQQARTEAAINWGENEMVGAINAVREELMRRGIASHPHDADYDPMSPIMQLALARAMTRAHVPAENFAELG